MLKVNTSTEKSKPSTANILIFSLTNPEWVGLTTCYALKPHKTMFSRWLHGPPPLAKSILKSSLAKVQEDGAEFGNWPLPLSGTGMNKC